MPDVLGTESGDRLISGSPVAKSNRPQAEGTRGLLDVLFRREHDMKV